MFLFASGLFSFKTILFSFAQKANTDYAPPAPAAESAPAASNPSPTQTGDADPSPGQSGQPSATSAQGGAPGGFPAVQGFEKFPCQSKTILKNCSLSCIRRFCHSLN